MRFALLLAAGLRVTAPSTPPSPPAARRLTFGVENDVDISATISGGYKFAGAAAVGNLVVFAPSRQAHSVGVFDFGARAFTTVATGLTGQWKFNGAVAVGDSVVFAPANAIGVGIFDVSTRTFTHIDISAVVPASTADKFEGAVAVGDLVIFGPRNVAGVGVFNVRTHAFTLIDISGFGLGQTSIFNGAAAVGNLVIFAPSHANAVGVFDVSTYAFTLVDISGFYPFGGGAKFTDAAAVGDKVIFTPYNADAVGIFEVSTRTFSLVDMSPEVIGMNAKFLGSITVGNIVLFAQDAAPGVGVLDVARRAFSLLDMYGRFDDGTAFFSGGVAVNGTAVFTPFRADRILMITPEYCDTLPCETGSFRAACGYDPSFCVAGGGTYSSSPTPPVCDASTHTRSGRALLAVAQLKGACTPCTGAVSSATYYTSDGGDAYTCPTAACDNTTCAPGQHRIGNCGDDETRSNNDFSCVGCPVGTYRPLAGSSTQCVRCGAGTYQNEVGRTACKLCELGSYCPPGASNPLGCESGAGIPHSQTTTARASGPDECRCAPTFYDIAEEASQVTCDDCPSGSDCRHAAGFSLTTLPVMAGYYRLNERSSDIRRCPDAATNCSDAPQCPESTSGCRGTVDNNRSVGRRLSGDDSPAGNGGSERGCYDDLTGTFCLLCAPHPEAKRVYYAAATSSRRAQCLECRESARDAILAVVGFAAVAAVVALVIVTWCVAYLSDKHKQQLQYAWQVFTPHNKLKILIGFYMIATKVDTVYEVSLPPQVKRILAAFSVGVSFGFSSMGSVLECLGMRGYVNMLAVYIVTPLILAALIFLLVLGRLLCTSSRCNGAAFIEAAVPALLKLGFLAYPLVTNAAFDAFSCYDFTDSEWLKADVAIECGTRQHADAKALAWLAIIAYPIGLLLVNGALLFASRGAIQSKRQTPLSRAIAFLYREYEPQFFWWELVEMMRRLVLVGLMVLAQGSMLQLVMGTLLSAVFLLFQVQTSPYIEIADDFLASASSFGLVAIFLCSYAFKDYEFVALPDIADKMSTEQEHYYIINQTTLAAIMIASVLGTLFLSFVIFIVQLSIEGDRLRREALASKARRLRYKANNEQVDALELATSTSKNKFYHTFLSHVWGTGQDQMRIVKQRLVEMIPDLVVFLDVDDLEEIGDLEGYIERTSIVLVYCSKGYFASRNCMRELVSAVAKQKPFIALTDPETNHGGLSLEEIHTKCLEADALSEKWGFLGLDQATSGANYQEAYRWPGGQALHDALFASEAIEWNRIGHFQDVTMRQIAERLLPDASGTTYVDREIVNQKLKPLKPPSKGYHIYCSALNPGATQIMTEVSRKQGFDMQLELAAHSAKTTNALHVTAEAAKLSECDYMLLYLTSQTWTRDEASAALGLELMKAMDLEVNVLLVHEMPGAGGQEARFGCEFGSFFACASGATPPELLKRGIYSSIAVPLKGGPWREASMKLLGMALGMSKEEAEDAKEGRDVLGLGADTKRLASSVKGMASTSLAEASKSLAASRQALKKMQRAVPSVIRKRSGETTTTAISVSVVSAAEPTLAGDGAEISTSDAVIESPPPHRTLVATFGPGPFGMSLKSDSRARVTTIGTVDDGSQAMEQGVRPGSVILEVAGASVQGLEYAEVKRLVVGAERPLSLLLAMPAGDADVV